MVFRWLDTGLTFNLSIFRSISRSNSKQYKLTVKCLKAVFDSFLCSFNDSQIVVTLHKNITVRRKILGMKIFKNKNYHSFCILSLQDR